MSAIFNKTVVSIVVFFIVILSAGVVYAMFQSINNASNLNFEQPPKDNLNQIVNNEDYFWTDSEGVYYISKKTQSLIDEDATTTVKGADPVTFHQISESYTEEGQEHLATFRYYADKNHVYLFEYWSGIGGDQTDLAIVPNADVASFEAINQEYSIDQNSVYIASSRCNDVDCLNVKRIVGADADSFRTVDYEAVLDTGTDNPYDAQDKNHRYLEGKVVADIILKYWNGEVNNLSKLGSFLYKDNAGGVYTVSDDGQTVYIKVPEVDAYTIRFLGEAGMYASVKEGFGGTEYYADTNHVYFLFYEGGLGYSDSFFTVIDGADPATFVVTPQTNPSQTWDAQDKNHKYQEGSIVQ